LKFYGIKPSDRCCTLHTTNYSWNRTADYKDIVYSNDGKILSLCKLFLDDDHLKIYYDEVMKFKPIWLFFQPSVLIKFTEFIIKNKLTIPSFIKYIEFTGEVLTPLAVEYAEKYYNCNFANMYGTTETGTISYTCPYGNMHVLDDNVYLEIQKDQSHFSPKIGKAIVTSLNNNVFPLIRYDIGDIVSVIDCENCQCGLKGTVIETIMGRESRCVTLSSGLVISESIIISIFDRVNTLAGNKIKEYKAVINKSENLIVFMIHIAPKDRHWVKEIEKQLRNIVYERFHFNFELIFTYEPICIDNNGKYSIVEVV
jgi:phenylacetate-CoA ligase